MPGGLKSQPPVGTGWSRMTSEIARGLRSHAEKSRWLKIEPMNRSPPWWLTLARLATRLTSEAVDAPLGRSGGGLDFVSKLLRLADQKPLTEAAFVLGGPPAGELGRRWNPGKLGRGPPSRGHKKPGGCRVGWLTTVVVVSLGGGLHRRGRFSTVPASIAHGAQISPQGSDAGLTLRPPVKPARRGYLETKSKPPPSLSPTLAGWGGVAKI